MRILLALMLYLSACAPELGLQLSPPAIHDPDSALPTTIHSENTKVRVGAFSDSRLSRTFVKIDGRNVPSEGDLGAVVQEAFARYLRKSGAKVVILNAPLIEGEITEWSATVESSFPTSEAKSKARLKVVVKDTHGHLIYHALFSGDSFGKHPMLGEEGVQKILADAMATAIEAAVSDGDFMRQLDKGRIE